MVNPADHNCYINYFSQMIFCMNKGWTAQAVLRMEAVFHHAQGGGGLRSFLSSFHLVFILRVKYMEQAANMQPL